MTNLLVKTELSQIAIDLSSLTQYVKMTDEQFYAFCQNNRDLRIERSAEGEVIVMSPVFSDTGNRELEIAAPLLDWAKRNGTGNVFGPSAGFTLPNGAIRSPDASWIASERWNALSDKQKASFAPICPDFVVELRSASDTLTSVQEKMQEYIENGAKLGLLVDRKNRTVRVYRPGRSPEILEAPETVSCDPELPDFVLPMAEIW